MDKTILIVEDNDQDRKILERTLRQAGYQSLFFASSGEEGIEKAKAGAPVLIILDINLPAMSGSEAHNLLKQSPSTRNIPIIFNTGLMRPGEDAGDGANQSIVAKTNDANYLIKKVKEMIG